MYGLVLLTAMTSSGADVAQAPISNPVPIVAPVGCGGCGATLAGCTGCYGSCYGSCNGCYGSCHGGLFHGGHALFGHHKSSCHGCGGCTGYSCNGWNCFGSCYGSCSGCYGQGYGFGTLQSTPWQCHGGCYGGYYGGGSAFGPGPGGGWGYGPRSIYSDPYAIYGTVTTPPMAITPSDSKPMDKPEAPAPTDKDKKKDGMGASLKFRVPADAKLYVDGRLTTVGGTERVFTTPPLLSGQKFYYDVKAEIMVDGIPVIEEKRVVLEAGTDLTESFTKLFTAIESKTVPIAGK